MVNPNNFYTVQGWMVTELGLRGNELAAYAIIYGFSQDGASKFQGSLTYKPLRPYICGGVAWM